MQRLALWFLATIVINATVVVADDHDPKRASDEAEIRELFLKVDEAHRTGDVDTLAGYITDCYNWWDFAGGMLDDRDDGVDKEKLKAQFEKGLKFDWKIHHLKAMAYGDGAVTTCYFDGKVTLPSGNEIKAIWRNSNAWTRTKEGWKIYHSHVSPLRLPGIPSSH